MALERDEQKPEERLPQEPANTNTNPAEAPAPPSADEILSQMKKMQERLDAFEKRERQPVEAPQDNKALLKAMEAIEAMSAKSDADKYGSGHGYVDVADLDPDDLLDQGEEIVFYAHKTGYVIVDDIRQGLPVRTPFGKEIIFKYQATRRRQAGKEVELFNFSIYVCKSKKEAAWLMEHTYYGTIFYSRAEEALSMDARKAAKLAKYMTSLKAQDQFGVARTAKAHGIGMMENVNDMRIALANKLAEEEMAREKSESQMRLVETQKAEKLLGEVPG